MYYFVNVRVGQNVWAIVTDSAERRMTFESRQSAKDWAVRMGLKDYAIQESLYSKEYIGYR